jgi:hypothetical protein
LDLIQDHQKAEADARVLILGSLRTIGLLHGRERAVNGLALDLGDHAIAAERELNIRSASADVANLQVGTGDVRVHELKVVISKFIFMRERRIVPFEEI